MRRQGRPALLLAIALLACASLPSAALAERAFAPRFATNAQGDVAIAANASLTCIPSEPACPAARAGTASGPNNNNNARVMSYVDVDGDAATFNSSDATLTLPAGATVLFAGLYYGGRPTGGPGGAPAPNPAARGTVLLQAPGDADYRSLGASQVDTAADFYQGFVDVTGIVAAAGAGSYRVANVQVGTGRADSQAGGWTIAVAYRDAAAPSRNLSVFDGFQNVGSGSGGVTIPLSGFVTPLAGPVRSTIGIVAFDGDLGTTGDAAAVNGAALSNAVNPATNLFNASISRAGVRATDREPAHLNNLGYDADLFATTNVLTNGQTSTTVRLTTSGDAYAPGLVTIATELFAPRIEATKTVDAADADLGDELTYSLGFTNSGEDGAAGAVLTDAIPANTTYVPGSLEIVSGTNAGAKTDAAGDDQAEFDAAAGRVVVRLGVGATAGAGGLLAPGASATARFRVRVNARGVPVGTVVENRGSLAFQAQNTGAADVVRSPPAATILRVPDLSIQKIHQGIYAPGLSTNILIAVGNEGDGVLAGPTTVRDTLPVGLTIAAAPFGTGWSCSVAGQEVTCTYAAPIAPGESPFAIVVPVQVDAGADASSLVNTATVSAPDDGDPSNNSSTDSTPASGPEIDLSVTKTVDDAQPYGPGTPIEYAIVVRNAGPAEAIAAELTDTLPAPMDLTSITPSQGACTGTTCQLGTISPGGDVTVTLVGTLSGDAGRYAGDATLTNRASVTAAGRDRDAADNVATADIETVPLTDPTLDKSFAPAQPLAGGPVTYTMVLGNRRQTADFTFIDALPAALLNPQVSISGGTGICDLDLAGEAFGIPAVLCNIAQFENGAQRIVTLTGTLAPDSAGTTVTNIAAVSSDNALQIVPDEIGDNRDEVSFVPGSVDLQVTKERVGGTGPVPVGEVAEFRLTVVNAGTAEASDTTIVDTLPDGLVPVDVEPGCTASGQTITCGPFPFPPAVAIPITVRARAEPAAAERTLTNAATATTTAPDVNPADNAASADVTIGPYSLLSVTKAADAPTAVAGGTASFTATVRNDGPSAAGGVSLNEVLPDGLTLRSAAPSQGTCVAAACDLGGLAAGAAAEVRIVADVAASAAGRRVNAVEVVAATPHRPARAEAVLDVRPRLVTAVATGGVDVAVTVSPPPRAIERVAGTWRLEVVNNGPGTATGVTLTGAASRLAEPAGARQAQAGCTQRLPLTCSLGTLAPGARRTVALRLRPRGLGVLSLAGRVRADEAETTQANNLDRAQLQIVPGRTSVTVTKRADARAVRAGESVGFAITVRNRGPVTARGLEVCDRPPAGLALTRAAGARLRAGAACWSLARLAAGAARTYRVSARPFAVGAPRTAVNAATVRGVNVARATARAAVRVTPGARAAPVVTG